MANSLAYLNGRWIPDHQLAIPIDDLGFVLGTTLVERLRTFAGQLFRAEEHLRRLRRSLEIVGWDAEGLCAEVADALDGWIERNAALIADGDDWSVVALVTPGKTADAAHPTLCVHGEPLPFHQWADQFETGVDAAIVDVRQVPNDCWPAELKCRSRIHFYLADREAAAKRPGARAILLDQEGHVSEASTANVVAYYGDRGLVAPRPDNILPGISQEVLFELADRLDIAHSEQNLSPAQLAEADEVFLTSTSICLLPIVTIDGRSVGSQQPGPRFRQLLAAWTSHAGIDIAAQSREFARRER